MILQFWILRIILSYAFNCLLRIFRILLTLSKSTPLPFPCFSNASPCLMAAWLIFLFFGFLSTLPCFFKSAMDFLKIGPAAFFGLVFSACPNSFASLATCPVAFFAAGSTFCFLIFAGKSFGNGAAN